MIKPSPAANALRAIGMHPKYKGYAYILCILEETSREPRRLYGMSADFYPIVKGCYEVSPAALERCMRFAIRRTWEGGNPRLRGLFEAYDTAYAPTVSEFIAVMTECICCRRIQ